jgi:hypothetical protein
MVIQGAFRARFAYHMLVHCTAVASNAATLLSRFWRSVRHFSNANVSLMVQEEKLTDGWSQVLNMHTVRKMAPRGFSFSGSIRFNRWKVCMCYKRDPPPTKAAKPKRETDDTQMPPSRGFWHIDEMKHLNVQDYFQLIGGDPGRQEIIRLVDGGAPPPVEEDGQAVPDCGVPKRSAAV